MNTGKPIKLLRFHGRNSIENNDLVAVEEPLEIVIEYGEENNRLIKNLSVTMRTPGSDDELAIGFLLTEGIIKSFDEIAEISQSSINENTIKISIFPNVIFDISKLNRHFYTSSSCGVCGKTSVDAVKTVLPEFIHIHEDWSIPVLLIYSVSDVLRSAQNVFNSTGGLHASGLFSLNGELIVLREDVGRHNALDKVIGAACRLKLIPLSNQMLLLSGRASFELIQKAAMAGIKMVLAIGAPSSLAVELANETGITLVGFLKGEKFNLYSGSQRVKFV